MNINLKATGMDLTPAISDYAYKKVRALEKFVPKKNEGAVFHVDIGKTNNHHKKGGGIFRAEIKVIGGGLNLYAVAEAPDLYAAIDIVESETARELRNEKGRKMHLLRRGERRIKDMMKGFPWLGGGQ